MTLGKSFGPHYGSSLSPGFGGDTRTEEYEKKNGLANIDRQSIGT